MKNTNSIGGMPVVCDGARIGRVLFVQFTPSLSRMAGLHVDCALRGRRYIPAERIRMLGEMAVLVEKGFSKDDRPPALPRRALAEDGTHLGCITGAWIDETTYGVDSLELSGGVLQDLLSGRTRVRMYHVLNENGDVLVSGQDQPALQEGETI